MMRNIGFRKVLVFGIIVLFITVTCFSSIHANINNNYFGKLTEPYRIQLITSDIEKLMEEQGDGNTDYWAVLIGVDCTESAGNDFTLPVEKNVECMYKTLLVSDHWESDHIKVLTGKDATMIGIIRALQWLDRMEDGDDISIIYYTGHGGYLYFKTKSGNKIPIDFPPFDEKDKCDEFITTYWTGIYPFTILTDDLMKILLNRLDSQGIGVIFDCCYSGGMSDTRNVKVFLGELSQNNQKAFVWMKSFSEDIGKDGQVTLMACRENEIAYTFGWRSFGSFLCDGFQGYADENFDNLISIEEAFEYAAPKYRELTQGRCLPIIDDSYIGELLLTDANLPPKCPIVNNLNGSIGKPGIPFVFKVSSIDPEGNRIRYGWNSSDDSIENFFKYGEVAEWSDYFLSGDSCTNIFTWDEPNVYMIHVKAQDEYGAEIIPDLDYSGLWSKPQYILITEHNEIVDQYQLVHESSSLLKRNMDQAQSFKSNDSDILPKIKLKLSCTSIDDKIDYFKEYPLDISIRNNLNGNDLIKISTKPYIYFIGLPYYIDKWIEFDFPDLTIKPGFKYYIIISCDSEENLYYWGGADDNPYHNGEAYNQFSTGWSKESDRDRCFITYK